MVRASHPQWPSHSRITHIAYLSAAPTPLFNLYFYKLYWGHRATVVPMMQKVTHTTTWLRWNDFSTVVARSVTTAVIVTVLYNSLSLAIMILVRLSGCLNCNKEDHHYHYYIIIQLQWSSPWTLCGEYAVAVRGLPAAAPVTSRYKRESLAIHARSYRLCSSNCSDIPWSAASACSLCTPTTETIIIMHRIVTHQHIRTL